MQAFLIILLGNIPSCPISIDSGEYLVATMLQVHREPHYRRNRFQPIVQMVQAWQITGRRDHSFLPKQDNIVCKKVLAKREGLGRVEVDHFETDLKAFYYSSCFLHLKHFIRA